MVKCLALQLEIQGVNGTLEGLFIRDSLGSTDGKVLGSDEGTKLVSTNGKLLSSII